MCMHIFMYKYTFAHMYIYIHKFVCASVYNLTPETFLPSLNILHITMRLDFSISQEL